MRVCFFVLSILAMSFLGAKETQPPKEINEQENKWNSWARRTEVFYQTEARHTPIWSIQTIQPLYQTEQSQRSTFYTQLQASAFSKSRYYNAGLGYRYLSQTTNWMAGGSIFYDTITQGHQRMGAGLEFFLKSMTLRGNFYQPISGIKTKKSHHKTVKTDAMTGIDGELEFPCPFMPWIRFAGGGFYFHGKQHSKVSGASGRVAFYLTKFLRLEVGRESNKPSSGSNYGLISLSFGKPPEVDYSLSSYGKVFSSEAFLGRSLIRHTLEKVRRQNQVLIEKHETKVPAPVATPSGSCSVTCSQGQLLCDDACTDLQTSNQNCGNCGNACAQGLTCVGGACALVCPGSQIGCGGSCVNVSTDSQNCGSCGNACPPGESCVGGDCQ